jgi:hypothetical protein
MPIDSFEPLFRLGGRLDTLAGLKRSKQALHPLCYTCREQQRGAWVAHKLYSPSLDRFVLKAVSAARATAATRSIVFAIAKDDALGVFLAQDGKCALSGLELNFREKNGAKRGTRALLRPSIDRIDSAGNYTINNIQIVAAAVNVMKNDMSQDNFVALCERIAGHALSRRFAV